MLQIKKLKRPNKKSGKRLEPGQVSEWKAMGIKVVNTGKEVVYVDSVKGKRK